MKTGILIVSLAALALAVPARAAETKASPKESIMTFFR